MLERLIRAYWETIKEEPFFRLLRHCIDRIFFGGEGAADGEVDIGVGTVLAILSSPGMFISLGLATKYSTLARYITGNHPFDAYAASTPDEYFLIVLAMVVAGSVAIWKWDSLLPDRRDYANLAHLPVPASDLFIANLLALLLLAVILSIDINAASSILFPLVVCWNSKSLAYIGVFFGSNLLSVFLAAAFGFLGVLSVLGVLMSVLPYRTFRKLSVYVRSALLISFVALLMTSSSEPHKIVNFRPGVRLWTQVPPPAWFLGLCQSLRGIADPIFVPLGRVALIATPCVFLVAVGAYALSYRRCFLRSAETMIVLPAGGGTVARLGLRLIDRIMLHTPLERAGYRFTLKTLFRSEAHSLTWIGFTAVGVLMVSNSLLLAGAKAGSHAATFPSVELLGLPLVLTYFLMFGVRCTFEIPGPLRANWLFRLCVDPATHQYTALARRVMITFEIPLLLVSFGMFWRYWGGRIAAVQTAVVAVMALLLIDTLLVRFRKIPFTCSAPPFKDTTIVSFILYVLGFFWFSEIVPVLEQQAFYHPHQYYPVLIAFLLAVWAGLLEVLRKNQTELERRLIYDDTLPPVVEALDLTFRR
ncbi:MAG TPA: hypothetical protein VNU84_08345 [Candidatus Acidoferrum sp.]|jgi:hypothetical protein|nr:hypothetical protein [Candidatus Acidoferrum sp.]